MPSDFAFKVMNAAHHGIIKLTGGRAGWSALGMPVLKLTTTGRSTDRPRVVMLTSPVQDGEALVVVASRGGDDKTPAWFLNLQQNPSFNWFLNFDNRAPWMRQEFGEVAAPRPAGQ